jgi:lytic murein transglycosylase
MKSRSILRSKALTIFALATISCPLFMGPAAAADAPAKCQKDMDFNSWRDDVVREARAKGISERAIQSSLPYMTFDHSIIKADGKQGVFQQSFLQFSDRMASAYRMQGARKKLATLKPLLDRIEQRFGVPGEVLMTYWALESDFSSNSGKYSIIRSVTTLAYDCRRPSFFRQQLLDALRIVDRGDLAASEMIGDWAGEASGMQITPTDYYKSAVDFDGDGRRDIISSQTDMLATAANLLANLGWQRDQPWMQEVRIPQNLPWAQADVKIKLPRSQWAKWGVRSADGSALPNDDMPSSLLLPMGHLGPAFLVYPNFKVFTGWNASMVYSITASYLATRVAGAPAMYRGNVTEPILSTPEVIELQGYLIARGLMSGTADGKMGAGTREAVKQAQLQAGLPADSYPTRSLLAKLRGSN